MGEGQGRWLTHTAQEQLRHLRLPWEAPKPSSARTNGQRRSGWMSGTDRGNKVSRGETMGAHICLEPWPIRVHVPLFFSIEGLGWLCSLTTLTLSSCHLSKPKEAFRVERLLKAQSDTHSLQLP